MSNIISIYSGNITNINLSHREIKESCGIFVGPLFAGSRKQRIEQRKIFMDHLVNIEYPFVVPIYHIYSHDEYFLLKHLTYLHNYNLLDEVFCSHYIADNIKLLGISGQINSDIQKFNKKYLPEQLLDIAKKEKYCDILCFNSLNISGDVVFPVELYQMIYQLKPKLIIIGGSSELKTFNFPTTDIKTVLLGKDNHLIYDIDRHSLFRKI